jgi:hypothetical protein
MKPARSVVVTPKMARRLLFIWLACFTLIVRAYAAPPSLSQQLAVYDYSSVMWAAIFGLMGGVGRSIIGLLSENGVVLFFWRGLARDLVFAIIGGAFVYIVFLYLQVLAPNVFVNELRIIVIFVVGASRGKWYDAFGDLVIIVFKKWKAKFTGEPLPPDPLPPTTVAAPLDPK